MRRISVPSFSQSDGYANRASGLLFDRAAEDLRQKSFPGMTDQNRTLKCLLQMRYG
jgi:hypothetical protein